ncbi:MAG: phosphoglycerate mutase family protein [Pseudomonadota bacterium]
MRMISILLALTLGACVQYAQTPAPDTAAAAQHEIYLVRHAEKQTGDDPALTDQGRSRADVLADLLSDKGLTEIYSTNYKRTLETAAPIAERTRLEVQLYDASDLDAFAEILKSKSGVILVVGHSNTTPPLAAALGGDPGTAIDESTEYDRLYVIDLTGDEPVSRIDRFGVRYQPAE